MSRCFPFPPPGYEKKARPDYENFLEKEKEKKHKKEKKEKKDKKDKKEKKDKKDKKEKKERGGKWSKEKEKIEDKHREYDDQNEKCKENSYTAEKEKKRNSDGKYVAGVLGCSNGENPVSNCTQANGTLSDFKFLVELGKRIRDEDKATASPIIRKINLTCKRTSDLPGEVLKDNRDDERKIFGQRNKVDARGNGNGSGPNFMGGSKSKVEGVAGLVDKYAEKKMEQKENDKHKSSDSKVGRHKDKDRDKKSKSKDRKREKKKAKERAALNVQPYAKQNIVNAVFDNNGNLASPMKENSKISLLGKRKELEMNGSVLHDDDIRRSKLHRLLPSSDEVEENRRKLEARTSTHSCMTSTQSVSELVGTVNNHKVHRKALSSPLVIQNGPNSGLSSDKVQFGEHRKVNISVQPSCQVMENGNILEMGTAAASEWWGTNNDRKVENKVSLFNPVLTNEKVELHQAATNLATGVHAPISSQKVNGKEIKFNRLIEDKKPDVSLARPSVSLVKVEKSVGKSLKPPHPDSKYLSQLLNIPNIEWSGFDDQEWLLGSTDPQARSGSWQAKETKKVWAEALRIESADITALPYVLPF